MAEIAHGDHHTAAIEDGSAGGEVLPVEWERAELGEEELRAAYEGWLERRGINPASIPQHTMGAREFDMFRNAPPNYFDYTRKVYEIPSEDQNDCQYVLVDVMPDDSSQPPRPALVVVTEADFGTVISPELIAKDFQSGDIDPFTPESHPAFVTVDIGETLARARTDLKKFATTLMQGEIVDPFSTYYGDVAVRAGGLAPNQKDAYVWTVTPIAKAIELTLNSPRAYNSVCVVRGKMREAANGKPGMAQMDDNPKEVLKIQGEDLAKLQSIYRDLYRQPDFALTEGQKSERDQLFNDRVISLISEAAMINYKAEEEEARRRQAPKERHLERP